MTHMTRLAGAIALALATAACTATAAGTVTPGGSASPSMAPSMAPTMAPTTAPTMAPSSAPSAAPTPAPTALPMGDSGMIYGIDPDGKLVRIDPATPGTTAATMDVTGLGAGETVVGLDFRSNAANQGLYAVSSAGKLYSLDPGTGAATLVGAGSPLALAGATVGFDFNPAADRIRVVGGTENRRMHPDTGMVVDADMAAAGTQVDGALAYATGDANAGKTPAVVAAAYTNPDADAATGTTNYAIDHATDALVTQGTKEGVTPAVSPNLGTLFTVGALGVDAGAGANLDIRKDGTAWATIGTQLYQLDLATGKATAKGAIAAGELRAFAMTAGNNETLIAP